jgi:hypothetical protein
LEDFGKGDGRPPSCPRKFQRTVLWFSIEA